MFPLRGQCLTGSLSAQEHSMRLTGPNVGQSAEPCVWLCSKTACLPHPSLPLHNAVSGVLCMCAVGQKVCVCEWVAGGRVLLFKQHLFCLFVDTLQWTLGRGCGHVTNPGEKGIQVNKVTSQRN